jgi:5-methylcytosine-specific restriction endonuclease McrA
MTAKHAGRSTRRYKALRAAFRNQCEDERRPCWLCAQPIDYELPSDDPMSWSLDHRFLVSTHPHLAEDPANFEASHLDCNKRRSNKGQPLILGTPSRNW